MSPIQCFIIIVVFMVILFLVAKASTSGHKGPGEIFQQIALKRDGRYLVEEGRGGLSKNPTLYIPSKLGEVKIALAISARGKTLQSRFTIDIPAFAHMKMFLMMRSKLLDPGNFLNAKFTDIKIGAEAFDKAFLMRGDDELIFREILTTDVQQKLVELLDMDQTICLQFDKGKFEFSGRQFLREKEYEKFIDCGLLLLDRLTFYTQRF